MPKRKNNYIRKPWGHERVLYETNNFIVLRMSLKKGEETSLHKHLRRDELFIVLNGKGYLLCNGKKISVKPGKVIIVESKKDHRWKADEDLDMVEVTVPPLTDLIRIKDKYGRV